MRRAAVTRPRRRTPASRGDRRDPGRLDLLPRPARPLPTENTRVGKMTNYDRLVLELWTDGTVTPEMALVEAAKIYRKHLNPFIQFFDVGEGVRDGAAGGRGRPAFHVDPLAPVARRRRRRRRLEAEVSRSPSRRIDLSVRASERLESEGIQTVGELVRGPRTTCSTSRTSAGRPLREIKKKVDAESRWEWMSSRDGRRARRPEGLCHATPVAGKKPQRRHPAPAGDAAQPVASLFIHGRVVTTIAKAKATRPFAEKLSRARSVHANATGERRTARGLIHQFQVLGRDLPDRAVLDGSSRKSHRS